MTNELLIPLLSGRFRGQSQQVVDARRLHGVLGVRRDFSNWIRSRIDAYGFEQDVDYLLILIRTGEKPREFDSPKVADQTGRGGDRRSADYFLSLDMAKELTMVERTERGRQARRYFIDCEKQLRQLQRAEFAARPIGMLSLRRADLRAINRQAWADVVGEVHATFHRRREALVHERVQALTHRTTERGLLPDDLVPSWAK
jgi:phage anti-repressor protein